MKKILFIFLISTILLFAENIQKNNHNQQSKIYKVAILENWKPYYITSNKYQPSGYAIDLFETIASKLDLKYEYVVVKSWKELWMLIEDKKIDIIPNVGIALKRADLIDFTNTTDLFEISLFKNESLTAINSQSDITNQIVGVVAKNVCTKLMGKSDKYSTLTFNSFQESLDALKKNELDILCYPRPLVEYTLYKQNINQIKPFGKPLKVIKRAIGIVKGNKALVEKFNKELFTLQANGGYHKIYDKWFGEHKDLELNFEQLTLIILILVILFLILVYFAVKNHLLLTQKQLDKKVVEVEALHKRFSLAADEALAGYWEWNLKTNDLYLSPGWKKFLGYSENLLENSFDTFKNLIHPEDFENVIFKAESYIQKNSPNYKAKFRLQHRDGSYKWVNAIGTISPDDPHIFFGFHIDINDLTTTKETLIAQSKSVMMGEMLGLIAHQFKQPLSVISIISSNQLASINLEEKISNDIIEKDAQETLKQILYLSETIDTFRDFLKTDKRKVTTTIESVISSSLHIVKKSLTNNNIQLIQNLSKTDEIEVSNAELMQVFINILNNSKDAFKENNIDNRIISIRTLQHGKNIIIEIEDTAGGIPNSIINNIFNLYFTTKQDSNGSGVGLYIVKVILEEHYNGTIKVENTDKGTKFTLTIPTVTK